MSKISRKQMNANKISQWAGYVASFCSVTFIATMTFYVVFKGSMPSGLNMIAGWSMILSAGSGAVCLVSAIFGFFRSRNKSN
jgi:uncharacterized membrane protein